MGEVPLQDRPGNPQPARGGSWHDAGHESRPRHPGPVQRHRRRPAAQLDRLRAGTGEIGSIIRSIVYPSIYVKGFLKFIFSWFFSDFFQAFLVIAFCPCFSICFSFFIVFSPPYVALSFHAFLFSRFSSFSAPISPFFVFVFIICASYTCLQFSFMVMPA